MPDQDDNDDEEQFFKELAQDFAQNKNLGGQSRMGKGQLSNPLLESSKVSRQQVIDSENIQNEEVLFDLQREEEKEEEYDYFMQTKEEEENFDKKGQYHVMDDQDLGGQGEEDDEMLDEQEIQERNANMLGDLKKEIEKEQKTN